MEYFITQKQLFEMSGISANTNINDIKHLIPMVCDTTIVDILGRTFYRHMLTVYNDGTADSNELILIEYITKAVASAVKALAIMELSYPLEAKGVIRKNGQNMAEADNEATLRRFSIQEQYAQVYARELEDFLFENHKDYPIFNEHLHQSCLCGRLTKNRNRNLGIRGF